MYRECRCNKWCPYQNQSNCCDKKDDIIEDLCSNVVNPMDDMEMCECGFEDEDKMFPKNPMFGQSYVPWQTLDKTFTPKAGLKMGTIFPELVSPYMPCQSMREIDYLRRNNIIGEGCNK